MVMSFWLTFLPTLYLCIEVFDVGRYVVWTVYTLDHDVLQQTNKIYVATLSLCRNGNTNGVVNSSAENALYRMTDNIAI